MNDDDDPMMHAADEPTAMWGADALAELGLDRPKSEPPPAKGKPSAGSSVKVSLEPAAEASPQPKRSQATQWVLTLVGALVLAAVAFFVVRALR